MESYQARLDSFASKRKSSSSRSTIKWPHPTRGSFLPTPSSLAEAGFYWDPSESDRDSVTCFLCAKQLSEWEKDDDPAVLHWQKCGVTGACPWAVVRCGLDRDMDDEGMWIFSDRSRLPRDKAMERARKATFGTWWPHDSDSGHGATSTTMAKAGFVYAPQHAGDDTAMCLYCQINLSGWEKTDDPLQEHKKRETRSGTSCPFFLFTTTKPKPKKSAVESKAEEQLPPPKPKPKHKKNAAQSGDEEQLPPLKPKPKAKTNAAQSGHDDELPPPKRKPKAKKNAAQSGDEEEQLQPSKPKAKAKKNAAQSGDEEEQLQPSKPKPKPRPKKTAAQAGDEGQLFPSNPAQSGGEEHFPPSAKTKPKAEKSTAQSEVKEQNPLPEKAKVKARNRRKTVVESAEEKLQPSSTTQVATADRLAGTMAVSNPDQNIPTEPNGLHSPVSTPLRFTKDVSKPIDGFEHSSPAFPPLATTSTIKFESMTDEQKNMTVEHWIRYEIEVQFEQFKVDGRKRITAFIERAGEVRKVIEALPEIQ